MASFRTRMRNFAARAWLLGAKRTGAQCTYLQPNEDPVTLWCIPGGASKDLETILGTDSEGDARDFEIGMQDGFSAANAHLNRVITFEGHNYHVRRIVNPDTLEAIFVLSGVCSHPNIVGAN